MFKQQINNCVCHLNIFKIKNYLTKCDFSFTKEEDMFRMFLYLKIKLTYHKFKIFLSKLDYNIINNTLKVNTFPL